MDKTIVDKRVLNLAFCSALTAFDQGEIFIVPLDDTDRATVLPVFCKVAPRLVASNDNTGVPRTHFNPDHHRIINLQILYNFKLKYK